MTLSGSYVSGTEYMISLLFSKNTTAFGYKVVN